MAMPGQGRCWVCEVTTLADETSSSSEGILKQVNTVQQAAADAAGMPGTMTDSLAR